MSYTRITKNADINFCDHIHVTGAKVNKYDVETYFRNNQPFLVHSRLDLNEQPHLGYILVLSI